MGNKDEEEIEEMRPRMGIAVQTIERNHEKEREKLRSK